MAGPRSSSWSTPFSRPYGSARRPECNSSKSRRILTEGSLINALRGGVTSASWIHHKGIYPKWGEELPRLSFSQSKNSPAQSNLQTWFWENTFNTKGKHISLGGACLRSLQFGYCLLSQKTFVAGWRELGIPREAYKQKTQQEEHCWCMLLPSRTYVTKPFHKTMLRTQ